MAKKFSQFPSASSISPGDSIVGLKDGANTRFSFATVFSYMQSLFVPTSRKVNNKALTSDITLDASDVGAVDTADVGAANGVASLDNNGKVPGTQLDLSGKQEKITANGILKGDGAGGVTAATAGTDYQAPLTAGTDYATPAQLEGKANQSQLAYAETGTTASRNYTAGQYISLNGLLYTADTAIASGATFYTSGGNKNLTECVGGGFNNLIKSFAVTVTPLGGYTVYSGTNCVANGVMVTLNIDMQCPSGSWTNIAQIPSEYAPKGDIYFVGQASATQMCQLYIGAAGIVQARASTAGRYAGSVSWSR